MKRSFLKSAAIVAFSGLVVAIPLAMAGLPPVDNAVTTIFVCVLVMFMIFMSRFMPRPCVRCGFKYSMVTASECPFCGLPAHGGEPRQNTEIDDNHCIICGHDLTGLRPEAGCPACDAAVRNLQRNTTREVPCAECGYDLRGNNSGTCPECGKVIDREVE